MKKLIVLLLALFLLASPALAMTQDRAIELVKLADDTALGARQFWVSPSGEADGAWVFFATGGEIPYFKGAFWYVDEQQAIPLGKASDVFSWQLLGTKPEIFTAAIGKPESRRIAACVLVKGKPTMIENARDLSSLEWPGYGSVLYTMPRANDYNYTFLRLKGGKLVQESAVTISRADFETFPGAKDILAELEGDGWLPTEYLYRSSGVFTINVADEEGRKRHLYVYIDWDADGADAVKSDIPPDQLIFTDLDEVGDGEVLHPDRGWEHELGLLDGTATAKNRTSLETVPSAGFADYGG